MNWKLKATILATLSRIPGGRRVYHALQKVGKTNPLNFEESLSRATELVNMARESHVDLQDSVCVEVGTGWRPFVAMIFRVAGAKRVVTIDVNPWLDAKYATETLQVMRDRAQEIAESLAISEADVRARIPEFGADSTPDLPEILEACGLEYLCPGDARSTGLPDQSVDVVFSSNVLEHVPPEILSAIHVESRRILKPTGVAAHRFNPGDHFAHYDKSITGANFLRYSPKTWHWIGGSGLAYHNRLRCPEHRTLMKDAGFEIMLDRIRRDEPAEAALEQGTLVVHPTNEAIQGMSIEDLAADYMWLVGGGEIPRSETETESEDQAVAN